MAAGPEIIPYSEVRQDLWRPLSGASPRYVAMVFFLLAVSLWGLFSWGYQLHEGIGVAGIQRPPRPRLLSRLH